MTSSTHTEERDGFIISDEDGNEIHFVECIKSGSRREKAFMGLLEKTDPQYLILDTREVEIDV